MGTLTRGLCNSHLDSLSLLSASTGPKASSASGVNRSDITVIWALRPLIFEVLWMLRNRSPWTLVLSIQCTQIWCICDFYIWNPTHGFGRYLMLGYLDPKGLGSGVGRRRPPRRSDDRATQLSDGCGARDDWPEAMGRQRLKDSVGVSLSTYVPICVHVYMYIYKHIYVYMHIYMCI